MGRSAEEILEGMRNSKAGWKPRHFRTLYEGFGFIQAGRKHDVYIHPEYPDIRDTISRGSKELGKKSATDAVKNIEELIRRKKEQQGDD